MPLSATPPRSYAHSQPTPKVSIRVYTFLYLNFSGSFLPGAQASLPATLPLRHCDQPIRMLVRVQLILRLRLMQAETPALPATPCASILRGHPNRPRSSYGTK